MASPPSLWGCVLCSDVLEAPCLVAAGAASPGLGARGTRRASGPAPDAGVRAAEPGIGAAASPQALQAVPPPSLSLRWHYPEGLCLCSSSPTGERASPRSPPHAPKADNVWRHFWSLYLWQDGGGGSVMAPAEGKDAAQHPTVRDTRSTPARRRLISSDAEKSHIGSRLRSPGPGSPRPAPHSPPHASADGAAPKHDTGDPVWVRKSPPERPGRPRARSPVLCVPSLLTHTVRSGAMALWSPRHCQGHMTVISPGLVTQEVGGHRPSTTPQFSAGS